MAEEPLPEVRWSRGGEATGSRVATWNPVMESHGNLESHGKPDLFWCFFFLIFFRLKNRETIPVPFCRAVWLWWRFSCTTPTAGIALTSHWIALDHISFSHLET